MTSMTLDAAVKLLELPAVPTQQGELKRAYRAAVRRHPPDRDPDGFKRVREAYTLLSDPLTAALARFQQETPSGQLPRWPEPEGYARPRGSVALSLLRDLARQLPVDELLPEEPKS